MHFTAKTDQERDAKIFIGVTQGAATPIFVVREETLLPAGSTSMTLEFPSLPLPAGNYFLWYGAFQGFKFELSPWQPLGSLSVAGMRLDPVPQAIVRLAPIWVESRWTRERVTPGRAPVRDRASGIARNRGRYRIGHRPPRPTTPAPRDSRRAGASQRVSPTSANPRTAARREPRPAAPGSQRAPGRSRTAALDGTAPTRRRGSGSGRARRGAKYTSTPCRQARSESSASSLAKTSSSNPPSRCHAVSRMPKLPAGMIGKHPWNVGGRRSSDGVPRVRTSHGGLSRRDLERPGDRVVLPQRVAHGRDPMRARRRRRRRRSATASPRASATPALRTAAAPVDRRRRPRRARVHRHARYARASSTVPSVDPLSTRGPPTSRPTPAPGSRRVAPATCVRRCAPGR